MATRTIMIFIAIFLCEAPGMALAAPKASEAVFRDLIQNRVEASGRGDAKTYLTLIDPKFVHIVDSGTRRTYGDMAAMVRAQGGTPIRYRVENLTWRLINGLALTDCEIVEQRNGIELRWRETNVFRSARKRWLFLQHQETAIVGIPVALAVPAEALNDYVGRYVFPTGEVDIITRQGNRLFGQSSPGEIPTPLIAVSTDAFMVDGDATFSYFSRGRDGRVTHSNIRYLTGLISIGKKVE